MNKVILTVVMASLLGACAQRETTSFGQTSDSRTFQMQALKDRYVLDFSDGTKCEALVPRGQWITGKRKYDMTCDDGTQGKATFGIVVAYSGPTEITVNFTLDNGVYGDGAIRT